jgi:hypothetical protein
MGSKKNRVKKVFAPSPAPTTIDNNDNNAVDDDLMDDLLTALDSRDETVHRESATVLEEIQTKQPVAQAAPPDKAGSKSRFKARQVRPVLFFSTPALRLVCKESLSSRQGDPLRSPNSRRLSTLRRMRSSSVKPRMRSVRSTGYATSSVSRCTRY